MLARAPAVPLVRQAAPIVQTASIRPVRAWEVATSTWLCVRHAPTAGSPTATAARASANNATLDGTLTLMVGTIGTISVITTRAKNVRLAILRQLEGIRARFAQPARSPMQMVGVLHVETALVGSVQVAAVNAHILCRTNAKVVHTVITWRQARTLRVHRALQVSTQESVRVGAQTAPTVSTTTRTARALAQTVRKDSTKVGALGHGATTAVGATNTRTTRGKPAAKAARMVRYITVPTTMVPSEGPGITIASSATQGDTRVETPVCSALLASSPIRLVEILPATVSLARLVNTTMRTDKDARAARAGGTPIKAGRTASNAPAERFTTATGMLRIPTKAIGSSASTAQQARKGPPPLADHRASAPPVRQGSTPRAQEPPIAALAAPEPSTKTNRVLAVARAAAVPTITDPPQRLAMHAQLGGRQMEALPAVLKMALLTYRMRGTNGATTQAPGLPLLACGGTTNCKLVGVTTPLPMATGPGKRMKT